MASSGVKIQSHSTLTRQLEPDGLGIAGVQVGRYKATVSHLHCDHAHVVSGGEGGAQIICVLSGQAEVEGVEFPGGGGPVLLLPSLPEVAGGEWDYGGEGQAGSGVGTVAVCRDFIVAQVSSDSLQGFLKPCLEGLPQGLEGNGGIGKG